MNIATRSPNAADAIVERIGSNFDNINRPRDVDEEFHR
jgi:hypothetical protein